MLMAPVASEKIFDESKRTSLPAILVFDSSIRLKRGLSPAALYGGRLDFPERIPALNSGKGLFVLGREYLS
jgi:hypothetical protein